MSDPNGTRSKEVFHDEAPPEKNDHVFEPRAQWWTTCKHCGLAEAAHTATIFPLRYFGDDNPYDD